MTDERSARPPFRDARLAISLLTVVPTGVVWPEGVRTGAAAWFPAVGLVSGWLVFSLAAAVPAAVADRLGWVLAALVVLIGALATRMLHYDGLADLADAWWGGTTTERRLEIMADSHTGAFGATAVCLAVVLQVAALSSMMSSSAAALLVAPVAGRLAATMAAWLGVPARTGGLGRSVMGRPTWPQAAVTLSVVIVTSAASFAIGGALGLSLAGAGVALALVVPHYAARRVGGVTGDVMGASVLVVQSLVLVSGALLGGVFV